ncbi:hypothetical protein ACJ73_05711 [Blastomyces percursus]|uniref:AMP-activated protein kinase glycogen-binding domain-containing protein n=1 Tax=Blastomyces percursus TaxID=1658174 RepID=A0A1J9QRV1_9EURO|nr:hypothetical protein ACJ73_05711 [Blastomyces percursus]
MSSGISGPFGFIARRSSGVKNISISQLHLHLLPFPVPAPALALALAPRPVPFQTPPQLRSDPTASEVYVTGTFDNWTRSVKLDRTEDGFRKDVLVPIVAGKLLYKFVVDGSWKLDPSALQEDDGHHNTNNVLLRHHIKQLPPVKVITPASASPMDKEAAETMSGVPPESTTSALAAGVPKESDKVPETETAAPAAPAAPTISSAAPESTTATLAKDTTLESKKDSTPGAFPVTPAGETEQFSAKPIPATAGVGNPIQLQPGEPVPDPSSITQNAVTSTATTDQAGYEQDASAAGLAPPAEETVKTLPLITNGTNGVVEPFVQSAAPTSTTAALAGAVPLEKSIRNANGPNEPQATASDVPEVVKESLEKAHKEPEAAGVPAAVEEKKEVEEELLGSVEPAVGTAGAATAGGVPEIVRKSIDEAQWNPEAAAVPLAVAEKKEVEEQLLHDVKRVDQAGEPAPVITAETSAAAPDSSTATATAAPASEPVRKDQDESMSPKSPAATTADTAGAPTTEQTQPTVTTGPETTTTPAVVAAASAAAKNTSGTEAPPATGAGAGVATKPTTAKTTDQESQTKKKKKNRASAIFSKLKEKFK